jgi:hypothetical protein
VSNLALEEGVEAVVLFRCSGDFNYSTVCGVGPTRTFTWDTIRKDKIEVTAASIQYPRYLWRVVQ